MAKLSQSLPGSVGKITPCNQTEIHTNTAETQSSGITGIGTIYLISTTGLSIDSASYHSEMIVALASCSKCPNTRISQRLRIPTASCELRCVRLINRAANAPLAPSDELTIPDFDKPTLSPQINKPNGQNRRSYGGPLLCIM